MSSPGTPAVPFCTARMLTGTISPDSRVSSAPVSLSLTAWPSPAKVPRAGSVKVRVPMPAEESRTQTPARQAPVSRSATGVRVVVCCTPSRR